MRFHRMPKVQIAMLGASRTGKTTVLTSLYEQMYGQIVTMLDIGIKPEEKTQEILDYNLELLRKTETVSLIEDGYSRNKKIGIPPTEAFAPDSLPSYTFDFKIQKENNFLKLIFRDYPGGYIEQERKFVQGLLRSSDAVILTIDTPAMLVRRDPPGEAGVWHELRNQPKEILEAFQAAYTRVDRPRLVILAPVKCEKFVKTKDDVQNLLETTKQVYKPLLDFLGDPSRSKNFSILYAPIETLGNYHFSHIHHSTVIPIFGFHKERSDTRYSPQGGDELFIYLLLFIFNHFNIFNQLGNKVFLLKKIILKINFRVKILQGKHFFISI